ncbi:MAG TPA: anaerobic ribonucleoside-triphosphate reductase, partial [Trichococcus flocculiformis]|nr:anaerobic ribonucleoside-triphosphate reductase [Trichococcus flocculiformis]
MASLPTDYLNESTNLQVADTEVNIQVLKADGRVVPFHAKKIYKAIKKAERFLSEQNEAAADHDVDAVVALVVDKLIASEAESVSTDDIHDQVEATLAEMGNLPLAEAYNTYKLAKKVKKLQQQDIELRIQSLMNADQSVVNENANKDSRVFNTIRDLTAGVAAKAIGLRMLPKHVSNAHMKGDIHYHDLDYQPYSPMTNCVLIDFQNMLREGFKIGNAEVDSPRSVNTATAQMAQIFANVASSQYGGCSADRVDEVLAPYARLNYEKHLETAKEWVEGEAKQIAYAEEKTRKDIYDAMQSLEYEINTLYTSNGQTPFTTLGFGLGTDWFAREIQKAVLQVRIKGLGKERRTAIFPKLIFALKKGTNLETHDPNYDIKQLAITCATKRMYPDVLMYDKIVELTGSFKTPMGCRSFLQGWEDENGNEVNSGRMNLGVVTLNIPRIALESEGNPEAFWNIFEERLAICKDALVYRVERTKEATPTNAPILYQHGAFGKRLGETDKVDELFKNKRATVSLGYIGLYEAATVFYGADWETNPEAKAFTLDIVKKMKEKTDAWGNQYGYHFSVYSTPSESLTDRFCSMDTEKFGIIADITDKEYYTNSFHYDVRKNPNPFEKIAFEMEYPQYCSGGFIHYCEYPNLQQNPKALETVWDFAYDKVGYLGTNT